MRPDQETVRPTSYTAMGTSVSILGRCVTGHSSVMMDWMRKLESVEDSMFIIITVQAVVEAEVY